MGTTADVNVDQKAFVSLSVISLATTTFGSHTNAANVSPWVPIQMFSSRHTSGPTHLENEASAVHPGGDGGFFTRAGIVSSGVLLTKAALMSDLLKSLRDD